MLNSILKWSIAQRWLVVIGAIVITILGSYNLTRMPLDVFPSFAPPQVEIQTEAEGLAPEEIESLITLPMYVPKVQKLHTTYLNQSKEDLGSCLKIVRTQTDKI